MNRRSFIKGLIALASAPAIGKYVNVFKTEGARKGIENVASQGVDFFNMVIKKVMDEGNLVNESDRVQTYKHPDRPDINVEVDLTSGSSSVYFDTDQGTKAGAEIVKDIEMGPNYSELLENEEVYKTGAGGEVYKDVDEQITGGITNLEEFLKRKKGFAAGGRVGFSGGGIFRGLKGIQLGKVQKDLIKKYKDQGMDFIEAVTKGTDEGTQIVNNKKLNFLKTKFDNTNVYSDDYVKLIDEEIRLNDPEMFKDIRQFELNGRPELADKMRALRHPEWAEANFGEDYLTVLENRQVQGINRMMEDIDPNIKERSVLDDIDDMNRANIDDLFGRKKNAAGGRVGMFRGGIPKGLQAAMRAIMSKYGDDAITTADRAPQPEKTIQEQIMDFNARNPAGDIFTDEVKIKEAVDDIFPTGDYKMDAQMAAESFVENNPQAFNDMLFDDLDQRTQMKIYDLVLTEIQSNMAKMRELKKLTKPEKTLGAMKAGKGIDMSDPDIAAEFTRFMQESDPKGYAKIQKVVDDANQQLELKRFNPKGRKKNADGGSVDEDVSLTVIQIPDISESGVESLFKRR